MHNAHSISHPIYSTPLHPAFLHPRCRRYGLSGGYALCVSGLRGLFRLPSFFPSFILLRRCTATPTFIHCEPDRVRVSGRPTIVATSNDSNRYRSGAPTSLFLDYLRRNCGRLSFPLLCFIFSPLSHPVVRDRDRPTE